MMINLFWIEFVCTYLFESTLEYKYLFLIIKGIENGAVVRKFDFKFQISNECTWFKINWILVKPKIFESNREYLSNESEKLKFHSGDKKLCPVENSE